MCLVRLRFEPKLIKFSSLGDDVYSTYESKANNKDTFDENETPFSD